MTRARKPWLLAGAVAGTLALACSISANAQAKPAKSDSQGDVDAGIRLHMQVSEKEIGLPIYPGAKAHKDSDGESPAANLGLWGKSFGFRLVVLKLESPDAPAKVAAFYQKALAKYGKVLDCSDGAKKSDDAGKKQSPNALTCDDTPETGAKLYKSGTKGKQHIVGIEAKAPGSVFQLVLVDTRGIDTDEKAQ